MKNKPRSKYYLKNEDLYREILKSKELNDLTRDAQKMLILLSERVSDMNVYEDPDDKRDCIAFAQLDIFKYWRNFDPEKSKNAFAYYTQIIIKGMNKGWNQLHPKKYKGTIRISGNDDDSDGIYSF